MTQQLLGVGNSVLAMMLAILTVLTALNPSVRCGLLIRIGLAMTGLGYGMTALMLNIDPGYVDVAFAFGAQLLTNAGICIVITGWLLRTGPRKPPQRRRSDWKDTTIDSANPWGGTDQ